MQKIGNFATGALLVLGFMSLIACAGTRPSNLGVTDSKLSACPSTPNCVSSDAGDAEHRVAPLVLDASATEAWRVARETVAQMPRTHIVSESADYLYAECTSAVMGFVDDLELNLRAGDGQIAIRSASRLGTSDFGVNRQRVEDLRAALVSRGVVR